jgi:3-oxoadipate enol-lactonase
MGANAPQRVDRLILSNTSAYFPDKEIWNGRIKTVREKGLQAVVTGTMERWFTKDFREREPKKIQWMVDMFLGTKPEGYIGCGEAVRDMDHRELIKSIKAPTMVIAGRHDAGTTVEMAEFIRRNSPGASLTLFDAAHIANVEQQHDYTEAVVGFLTQK